MQEKIVNILIIDDDQSDQEMIIDILDGCEANLNIATLDDGNDVMDYLHGKGPCKPAATPDLILLDLNMPLKSGHLVLDEIKTDPDTKHIPVVIVTTSENYFDICDSYRKGANSYIRKQAGLENFSKTILQLGQYWTNTVILPTTCNQRPGGGVA